MRFFRFLVKKFIEKIEKKYVQLFELNEDLLDHIKNKTSDPEKRLSQINSIRTNNIVTTIWANTGTILGIIITLIGFLLTVLLAAYIPINDPGNLNFKYFFFGSFAFLFVLIYIVLIYVVPYLINRIVFHLPPKDYADISLNSLDKSEMLTFVAMKMWDLCNDFKKSVYIPEELFELSHSKDEHEFKEKYIANKNKLKQCINSFSEEVNKHTAEHNKELNNCIALMQLAAQKLDIQERELCNHIFKFSPYVYRKRIDTLKSSTLVLNNIIHSHSYESENSVLAFSNNLDEIKRIRKGIRKYSMRSLEQMILYNEIHDCLIGMSSIISTSRSLRIFCRGISESLRSRKNNTTKTNSKIDVCVEKMLSILHRSKAHYGMDLLIVLENFYKKKFDKSQPEYYIPEAIYSMKYPKRSKNKNLTGKYSGYSLSQIVNQCQNELCQLNHHIIDKYPSAINSIYKEFSSALDGLTSQEGRIYFCLFGYSRIVRNVLKEHVNKLEQKNIVSFVTKEDTNEMIDTQIYRYELNDEKPHRNLRKTFTASDDFFVRLINPKDKVVFIGGAEAFDEKNYKLLHTNNYQVRVSNLIKKITTDGGVNSEIWIIAGDYKVFDGFPDEKSLFGNEFFCDHYDTIDLYDLMPYRENVKLISNK